MGSRTWAWGQGELSGPDTWGGLSGSTWTSGTGDNLVRRMGHHEGEAITEVSEVRSEVVGHPDTKGGSMRPIRTVAVGRC